MMDELQVEEWLGEHWTWKSEEKRFQLYAERGLWKQFLCSSNCKYLLWLYDMQLLNAFCCRGSCKMSYAWGTLRDLCQPFDPRVRIMVQSHDQMHPNAQITALAICGPVSLAEKQWAKNKRAHSLRQVLPKQQSNMFLSFSLDDWPEWIPCSRTNPPVQPAPATRLVRKHR